ncbi:transcriptional regulator [Pseudoroseomonas wenyumeiae]|uniref:Transcriptional regulator n=1 Tax=Teichococcus wenyumeiae TaxID=2478470 RepID=A0A3A9J940_9PROT|nr:helix-turn-helix domain-containing protein [Pseudoroseomonas wenyumeiae]RKK01243.1 transcriptional regulator [Pseudoroseomonas wenyumeiae]RMI14591.1 transcriptional regulator [Pseudoroseomonas wenyumeiae]
MTIDGHLASQMLRGDAFDADCRSREVLVAITGKWSVLILVALGGGTMRFAELRRRVNGVSERMLAESLRQLARYRLIERRSFPVVPPHVEYTLTSLGHEAAGQLTRLTDWIEGNVTQLIADDPSQPQQTEVPSSNLSGD